MKTIAEKLAEYAQTIKYSNLPEDVIHEVKRRVIDSIGWAEKGPKKGSNLLI